jgi:hypothetical protein
LLVGYDYLPYPDSFSADHLAVLFVITNISCLIAAYTFNKISITKPAESQGSSILDSIMWLASLVSRPADIDGTLDELRDITALHDPAKPFTAEEDAKLTAVYEQLRLYLTTQEKLRKFTREELDAVAHERFGLEAAAPPLHQSRSLVQ